jgi:ubiquinone/menaquinone biosynthesis C-methylase UbiE
MATEREYVLGTGEDELARLAFQHRLWSDAAHEAWRGARIGPGLRVLDVGCGPGFASFDLAELVGPRGVVVGVDESASFINYLNAQSAARHLPQLVGVSGDVHAMSDLAEVRAGAGESGFDIAYARWLLCFVKDPGRVLADVAKLLSPGGRFVVNDYFNYEAMAVAPRNTPISRAYERIVRATGDSWRKHGGDPDIVGRLPALAQGAGLHVVSIRPMQRIARPGETMFNWVGTWWKNYVPKLEAMGAISAAERAAFFEAWDELASGRTHGFAVMPCVYEVLMEKAN